ncbi:unnamed protein product [Rhizophagus irregularis]|nr:unnamed protein product [Rhizophagus irregularis]
MLKHLGPHACSLLLNLVGTCLSVANIPDLWRHATVFPIPKPHEWKCQLKNTRPITLLEVIRKALVKLFYNRLALILASYSVLQGGNFARLPGGSCCDPIITLESIIHDSVVTKSPLWILSQDISKAFDSVNLTMLKFALQRLQLPNNAIQFLLSLFMARSNRVITAHRPTPSYRVRIGIDQGEVISPLLWVIYIDPLLTVLKNEKKDPYSLISPSIPTTLSSGLSSFEDIRINNLVFMDDSTLVSSSKEGMEHMLSITEEFYRINNTSANHNKYVLATNAISATQDLSPIVFNLTPSLLNTTATITVTPIPMSLSFRFLGVWFNINGSQNFIRKQLKQECNFFSAILRPAKLTSQQVVYLHNTVLIPKLEYRMQVTHLSKAECSTAASSVRTLVKHKAKLSRSTPDAILYLSQALGLINLFSHQQQSHFTNLFLLANSSSFFMKSLFLYRLRFIQFYFLIPISPLMVLDWAYWSSLTIFKQDYIASTIASLVSTPFRLSRTNLSSVPDLAYPNGQTPLYQCLSVKIFKSSLHRLRKRGFFYLSQLLTPQGTHLASWSVIYSNSTQKLGHARVTKLYQDLLSTVTDPNQPGLLLDQFVLTQPVQSVAKDLTPCIPLVGSKKHWIITLDNDCSPLFGKQLSFQPSRSTCIIAHWISDCSSRPGDLITLKPCPGCDFNMYKSSYKKKPVSIGSTSITANTLQIVATVSWAEIVDFVTNFIRCHSERSVSSTISSPAPLMDDIVRLATTDLFTAADIAASSPVDSGFLNSIAAYKHGVIHDWPSSSRAEAAAIYAALSASPANSVIKIYTNSQTAINDLKRCSSFTYTNSRLYYKTTNFELWAIIQQLIIDKNLSVSPFKVKAHSNFYWNDFADSLANTAHTADDSVLISRLDLAAVHDFVLEYDNVVCEANPRQLFKQYHQMLYMKDLLELSRFRFLSLLTDLSSYIINWALTWHTLLFQPKYDNSFTQANASLHYAMKFQLFLEELPTLESLKRLRPDLYIDILTCRSCEDQLEDFMHLFMCKKRRVKLQQILNSYLRHLTSKITETGIKADRDFSAQIDRIISLPCWSFSSSNWSSYSLVRGCLPSVFLEVFMELDIPRLSAMNVIAAIHNNFINKFRKWIWNPRSYDKGKWEHAMNITSKLKNSLRPKGLPKSLYLPYSSLPPPTHVFSRDSGTNWLKNSMQYGLTWFDHISGFMGRLTVLLNNSFCRMECRF